MKTLLYLDGSYCTKLSQFKRIIDKAASEYECQFLRDEIITAFKDGIIRDWINDLGQVNVRAQELASRISEISTSNTDSVIFQSLSLIMGKSVKENLMQLRFSDYVDLLPHYKLIIDDNVNVGNGAKSIYVPWNRRATLILSFYIKKNINERLVLRLADQEYVLSLLQGKKEVDVRFMINEGITPLQIKYNDELISLINRTLIVDMGLDVKWASTNIGASQPEDIGCLFKYKSSTVQRGSYADNTILRLSGSGENFEIINSILPEDAHWRLPTFEQCRELIDICDWERNGDANYIRGKSKRTGEDIVFPIYQSRLIWVEDQNYGWNCLMCNYDRPGIGSSDNGFLFPVRPILVD